MRLIDADDLKEQLKQRYENALKWRGETVYYQRADGEVAAYLEAIMTVNKAPTVDAVPVVRCKDCEHSKHWYSDKRLCYLWSETGIDVFDDGYCSYGKRSVNDDSN